MSSLPENAFLPPNLKDSPERFGWMARRNNLFAQATAEEKKVLLDLAEWHGKQRMEWITRPNIFDRASSIRLHYWLQSLNLYGPNTTSVEKPGFLVTTLAWVARILRRGEEILLAIQQRRFLKCLKLKAGDPRSADILLGVLHFFCSLRFEIVPLGPGRLTEMWRSLAEAIMERCGTPPKLLLERVVRIILLEDSVGHQHKVGTRFPDLRKHAWRLLFRAVKLDPNWAYRFIDQHWRRESKWSGVLSAFALHGQFDLAHQLAIATRAERPEFAADMLLEAIRDAGWQATKDMGAAPVPLISLLDTACDHLWDWIQESLSTGISNDDIWVRLDALFRYGNPVRPYWSQLPACSLKVIESMSFDEQVRVLPSGLLARAIFYSTPDQQTAIIGTALFRAHLQHCILTASSVRELSTAAVEATKAIEVLEGGILSGRNRFVAAQPEHPLMQVVAEHLDKTRDRMQALQPSTALADQMQLTLATRVETLFRRLMDQFRVDFTLRVEAFPTDAGLALKSLIQYKGYSQTDDDMYRKQACQDLFDALLPPLEVVSAKDAAVARSGIGWSPRPPDL